MRSLRHRGRGASPRRARGRSASQRRIRKRPGSRGRRSRSGTAPSATVLPPTALGAWRRNSRTARGPVDGPHCRDRRCAAAAAPGHVHSSKALLRSSGMCSRGSWRGRALSPDCRKLGHESACAMEDRLQQSPQWLLLITQDQRDVVSLPAWNCAEIDRRRCPDQRLGAMPGGAG